MKVHANAVPGPAGRLALVEAIESQGRALPPDMAREWAYGVAYRSHHHRNRALPHWLRHYNETRPHSSLGGRPPISRVHNERPWAGRLDSHGSDRGMKAR
jgi:transposase InsO family protein